MIGRSRTMSPTLLAKVIRSRSILLSLLSTIVTSFKTILSSSLFSFTFAFRFLIAFSVSLISISDVSLMSWYL